MKQRVWGLNRYISVSGCGFQRGAGPSRMDQKPPSPPAAAIVMTELYDTTSTSTTTTMERTPGAYVYETEQGVATADDKKNDVAVGGALLPMNQNTNNIASTSKNLSCTNSNNTSTTTSSLHSSSQNDDDGNDNDQQQQQQQQRTGCRGGSSSSCCCSPGRLAIGLALVAVVVFVVVDATITQHHYVKTIVGDFLQWMEENPKEGVVLFVLGACVTKNDE
jgi:hypothetical protein